MICPNCGTNVPDQAKFCAGCGRPLPPATSRPGGSGQPSVSPPKKKKTGLIIGLAALVSVLAIAIVVILLQDRPEKNRSGNQTEDGGGQNTQAGQDSQTPGDDSELPADTQTTIPLLMLITPAAENGAENSVTLTYVADGFHLTAYAYTNGSLYQTTESDYDSSGRITHSLQQIEGQGVTIERNYEYDENGNLSHSIMRQTMKEMPESEVVEDITYTYDSGGTVTQMSAPPESNRVYELEFNSDKTVKAVKAGFTDSSAFTLMEYQYEDGCIASVHYTLTDSDGTVGFEQELIYDKSSRSIADCGNLLTETTFSKGSEFTNNYEFTDAFMTENGILLGETLKAEKVLYKKMEYFQGDLSNEFTYDGEGRLIQEMEYADSGKKYKYTEYEYDENGRECLAEHLAYGADDLLHSYGDYQYDENGNVISKTWYDMHTGEQTPLYVYQYTYGADSRLLNRSEIALNPVYVSQYFEYEYDEQGNKTASHEYALREAGVTAESIKANGEYSYYTYDNEYDDQGRLVSSCVWYRIIDNEEKNPSAYTTKTVYEYDADGDLIKESSYANEGGCYAYTDYSYLYK